MELKGHDKYQLGDLLGAGGMAEVYRGEIVGAEGFTRPVAIKHVLAEYSANKKFAEMFINEARISSVLNHPNVVSITDFDRDGDGCLFLVMELVDGKDLDKIITTCGPLAISVAIHVIVEVLRGLGYAHELVHQNRHLGIVHRDVSPHNVLLSWDGAVKVSDFGIAKAAASTDATRSGMLKGKIAYMSPEQAHQLPLDGRSDQFAVGIMLYQMLTGAAPFIGGSIGEILAHVLMRPPRPARELRPDLPADIDAVLGKMLEKDRELRYQSDDEAIAALLGCADASARARDELIALLRSSFAADAPQRPTPASASATSLTGREAILSGLAPPGTAPGLPTGAAPLGTGPAGTPPAGTGPAGTIRAPSTRVLAMTGPAPEVTPTPAGQVATAVATQAAPPRRGWLVAALFAMVVIAGAIAVVVLGGGDGESGSAAQVATASDAGSSARPVEVAPPVLVVDAGVVSAADAAAAAPVAAADASVRVKHVVAKRGKGKLVVRVRPWAEVTVDGKSVGSTPVNLDLPVGRHRVVLSNPELGKRVTKKITIRKGQSSKISADWD